MRTKKFIVLALFTTLALILAACGGGGGDTGSEGEGGEGAGTSLQVLMNDIYYGETPDNIENPPVWTVPAGAQVSITLDNQGALEHNWAIVRPGETVPEPYVDEDHRDIILQDTGLVDPGNTVREVFTAPEAGEYTIICTVAGHYPAMQGRLIVTE